MSEQTGEGTVPRSATGTVSPRTLRRLRRLALWMDAAWRIPGTQIRIGLDPLIGLVPGVGDVVGVAVAAYPLWLGIRAGVPTSVLLRMLTHLCVDAAVGSVPIVGDLFDIGFRANLRNARLLEESLSSDPARDAPE